MRHKDDIGARAFQHMPLSATYIYSDPITLLGGSVGNKAGTLISKEEFLKSVLAYNPKANGDLLGKAFDLAKKAHGDAKRLSGDPYFLHPLEVTKILVEQHLDTPTLCAALLHDVLEDTKVRSEDIRKIFGEEVLSLVEGVTKIEEIKLKDMEEKKAEDLRKILLATTKDVRVILIKLADRLHNMRTLRHQPVEKQKRISLETIELYAPLAHKLGMNRVKSELEDLCLFYLEPEVYQYFKKKINKKKEVREQEVTEIIDHLTKELGGVGIKAKVDGRAKSFYSIFRKMKKKKVGFEDIYDLMALRVVVNSTQECYGALGVVHKLYRPMPGKFKDYVSLPKSNGYQSLHTVVVGSHGKVIEVQIRSWDMHHAAEEGIAAHWLYSGKEEDKGFDKKVAWLKQILEWLRESSDAKDFIDTLKIDLFKDEIIVFTPKGKPIPLPDSSTPIDFAYAIHTDIGNRCSKAKVNTHIVPLDHRLKSGDIVEIVTTKDAQPTQNWLKSARTSLARQKIRHALGITLDGSNNAPKKHKKVVDSIQGFKKSQLKFSKCCTPKSSDKIRAFKTTDGKITLHKSDCINIHTMDPTREVDLSWEKKQPLYTITVDVKDRVGMLSDVLKVFTKKNTNIVSVHTNATKDHVKLFFNLRVEDEEKIITLTEVILKVPDVMNVRYERQE